jgi:hypothetical protein
MVTAKCQWFGGNQKTPSSDRYFCVIKITGITYKSKHTVKYPDLPSTMRPVPHSGELPVPKPLEDLTCNDDNSDSHEGQGLHTGNKVDGDPTFEESCVSSQPHLSTKGDLKRSCP